MTDAPPVFVGFIAEDQADAERQALAWAAAEPRVVEAHLVSATLRPGSTMWVVGLQVTWWKITSEPEQPTLGLA